MEAVFEDPGVKAEVTENVLKVVPADCIFATNTSTLPDHGTGQGVRQAEQFIGIHFFSPVDKMMLVEDHQGREDGRPRRGQGAGITCARSARRPSW